MSRWSSSQCLWVTLRALLGSSFVCLPWWMKAAGGGSGESSPSLPPISSTVDWINVTFSPFFLCHRGNRWRGCDECELNPMISSVGGVRVSIYELHSTLFDASTFVAGVEFHTIWIEISYKQLGWLSSTSTSRPLPLAQRQQNVAVDGGWSVFDEVVGGCRNQLFPFCSGDVDGSFIVCKKGRTWLWFCFLRGPLWIVVTI